MSNHPTIAALKARLESENNAFANENWNMHNGKLVPQAIGWIEKQLIKSGHKAATERLLPLIEKAVEILSEINIDNPSFEDSRIEWMEIQIDKSDAQKIREFLAEIEKELK